MTKMIKSNYNKMLGFLIKNGNKTAAERILTSSLIYISKRKRIASYKILSKIFNKLDNAVEVKSVTRGKGKKKRTKIIPFPVKLQRQSFLKIKWIVDSAKEDIRQINFAGKLATEFWNILYDKKKSKALAKRREIKQQVLENRSNSHFRW